MPTHIRLSKWLLGLSENIFHLERSEKNEFFAGVKCACAAINIEALQDIMNIMNIHRGFLVQTQTRNCNLLSIFADDGLRTQHNI